MIRMTLDCVSVTQSSVIWIIHRNVGMKCFFIYLNVRYYDYVFTFMFHKVV